MGSEEEMICEATLSYLRSKMTESQISLIFETEDKESAISDLHRWVIARHEAVPDYFTKVLAVKISPYYISKIDGRGSCYTQTQGWFYEWKIDFPGMEKEWDVK